MRVRLSPLAAYVVALGLATLVAASLLLADSLNNGSVVHGYMLWNVTLAWIPFGLSLWLHRVLTHKLWSSWEALIVTAGWLAFLPNTFYLISDFVHLLEADSSTVLFQVALFMAFVFVGLALGLSSLFIVHRELLKRLSAGWTTFVVAIILLACSFAVYIGRDLRWNSWDILVNPGGLLFDISARAVHPTQYPAIIAFVVPFFALLAGMYAVAWAAVRVVPSMDH
jgi:uncharacterized membrane protein